MFNSPRQLKNLSTIPFPGNRTVLGLHGIMAMTMLTACGARTPHRTSAASSAERGTPSTASALVTWPAGRLELLTPATTIKGDSSDDTLFYYLQNGIGWLDPEGRRTVASLTAVRKFANEPYLRVHAVQKNGAYIFRSDDNDPRHGNRLAQFYRAPAFDGPITLGGHVLPTKGRDDIVIIGVDDAQRVHFVSAFADRIEEILPAPRAAWESASYTPSGEYLEFVDLVDDHKKKTCFISIARQPFERSPECLRTAFIPDGEMLVNERRECRFLLDAEGHKHRCGEKLPDSRFARSSQPEPPEAPDTLNMTAEDLPSARWIDSEHIAFVHRLRDGTEVLMRADPRGEHSTSLRETAHCRPMSKHAPIFQCGFGNERHVVRVGVTGEPAVEHNGVERGRAEYIDGRDTFCGRTVYETGGGGLAIAGLCDGRFADAACVRSPNGRWSTVPFSKRFSDIKASSEPGGIRRTVLLPTRNAKLYALVVNQRLVGASCMLTTVSDEEAPGEATFDCDPVLETLTFTELNDSNFAVSYVSLQSEDKNLCYEEFSPTAGKRLRKCRSVERGAFPLIGRVSMIRDESGALLESLDTGRTWTNVNLPPGAPASQVVCNPIGCRIGPYFRRGWGGQ